MTYFPERGEQEQPYRQLFHEPVVDDAYAEDPAEDIVEENGYTFTPEELEEAAEETAWRDVQDEEQREKLLARRDFFRASVWVRDLVLVVLFTAASLLLVWLIVEMIRMTGEDLQTRFTVLENLNSGAGAPGGMFRG